MADAPLDPCPFCGSTRLDMSAHPGWALFGFVLHGPSAFVSCNECAGSGPSAKTPEVAAQRWNTRCPTNGGTHA